MANGLQFDAGTPGGCTAFAKQKVLALKPAVKVAGQGRHLLRAGPGDKVDHGLFSIIRVIELFAGQLHDIGKVLFDHRAAIEVGALQIQRQGYRL